MIDAKKAADTLSGLGILKFFPTEEGARTELAVMTCEMCSTDEQIEWLVRRARNLWNDWKGPQEFRALLCSKFQPADGIEAYSEIYPEGIPSENPEKGNRLLSAAGRRELMEPASADPEMNALITNLAGRKRL